MDLQGGIITPSMKKVIQGDRPDCWDIPLYRIEVIGWIHEDELPSGYPYDEMLQFSRVDGVRMFPVFSPVEV
jgi:hypothetical protein